MIQYLFGLATGMVISTLCCAVAWPVYVAAIRKRGETWSEARERELRRLDRLAQLEEIPDTQRSYDDRGIN